MRRSSRRRPEAEDCGLSFAVGDRTQPRRRVSRRCGQIRPSSSDIAEAELERRRRHRRMRSSSPCALGRCAAAAPADLTRGGSARRLHANATPRAPTQLTCREGCQVASVAAAHRRSRGATPVAVPRARGAEKRDQATRLSLAGASTTAQLPRPRFRRTRCRGKRGLQRSCCRSCTGISPSAAPPSSLALETSWQRASRQAPKRRERLHLPRCAIAALVAQTLRMRTVSWSSWPSHARGHRRTRAREREREGYCRTAASPNCRKRRRGGRAAAECLASTLWSLWNPLLKPKLQILPLCAQHK
jgi:hypothetical protein